ncbi:hypothetical protein TD95_000478 [Thielaviopsis punctulata]|uniref:OPA3-like protein n=1 Tax=Thielaviopsis punctulata TaxID=72032 RepID=A0A0F4ZC05_9PEZI|nr:hypothetical protein TD95_000478 [Thielaviopsis punctulata]
MVNLPLFKLGALFLRHVSKYGAILSRLQNHIKAQAHEHPSFRVFAARYGQVIHQINMRLNVAVLRNASASSGSKTPVASAPTVKTKEQIEREEAAPPPTTSIWRRKFKALPEAKAVDLFADVIGDSFILSVAMALLLYEWWRSSSKPDANAVRLEELRAELEAMKAAEEALAEKSEEQQKRIQILEDALNRKWKLLPSLSPASAPTVSSNA